ncbi:unnamed protein product [Blepharisma stoltei]|uniref:Uncharacterized protein n=1 Tax=Blepharisma stoltei TaxID=1481888 RepID=A0AAU9JAN9_9CILI|nr:unnamed protein product [Blepharisma stoltei]
MRKFIAIALLAFVSANVILPSRIFQVETGEVFALQSVTSEDAARIESVMGCSLKCVDMCFQFAKGMAAVQCTQQCGCKDLLTPIKTTQLFSDFSIEITTPKTANDDWDIDLTIGQDQDKQVNIEAGTEQIDETTTESHVEVDIAGADPDNKEFTYSKVKAQVTNETDGTTVEASHSEWTTPGGELDGSSDSIKVSDGYGNSEKAYAAEFPNQDAAVVHVEEKQVTPTEDGAIVDEYHQAAAVKNTTDPLTGETNTSAIVVEYGSSTDYSADETSGSIYKEEGISWQVINTISIKPIVRSATGCEVNCSNFCSELKGDIAACMTTCNANFCAQAPAQVKTAKPKAKSFGVWAWVVSIAILGVAVAVFLRKVYGTKSRRVMNDFNESSASYKILV